MRNLKDNMDARQIEELIPFYVLDALTDVERKLVDSYMTDHPNARAQIEELSAAASLLPHRLTPIEPPPGAKNALMARVAADVRARASRQDQLSHRAVRVGGIFQALGLGGALIAIIWVVVLNIQLSQLRKEVSLLDLALVAQSNSLQQINAKLPQVTNSSVVTISLSGTSARADARGQLIADPNSHSAVLVISGLGQLEAGQTYQVWLIDGAGPKSAGLLTVDANGQGLLVLSSKLTIAQFKALGISIEPDGGSSQPTGEIVVLSDL